MGAWARREALLAAALAAAGALVAVGIAVGIPWLTVVGVAVAAAGAVARLVIAEGRARLERGREVAEAGRRVRVPVAPVEAVDPTLIGIDRAEQTLLPGGGIPEIDAAQTRVMPGHRDEAISA